MILSRLEECLECATLCHLIQIKTRLSLGITRQNKFGPPPVITGIDLPEILDQAIEAVRTYKRLDESELAAILARTKTAAAKGAFELYKTSTHFDGRIKNPQWLW